MANVVEQVPSVFAHRSTIVIQVRDGRTGEIKATRTVGNHKVYGTFNLIVSSLMGEGANSCVMGALGSGPSVQSSDALLSGELASRTFGNLSHDANSPTWSLSFSWTDLAVTISVGQAGIFTSMTGGALYLKASFARVTVNSQDVLNIAWTQSLASA